MSDNIKQESVESLQTKEQEQQAGSNKRTLEAENDKEAKKAFKEKKKKEKKPADPAKKKKRRKIILFVVIGVLVLLFILSKLFGGNGAGRCRPGREYRLAGCAGPVWPVLRLYPQAGYGSANRGCYVPPNRPQPHWQRCGPRPAAGLGT